MSVAVSMFTSINIAGLIGTMSPMISKRLGFDPAITSGPFETAFQDVIGISIFLTVSTFLTYLLINELIDHLKNDLKYLDIPDVTNQIFLLLLSDH